MKKNSRVFSILTLVFVFLISCDTKTKPPLWDSKVIPSKSEQPDSLKSISIDVYLDATASMKGFASNGSSNYSAFLNEMEDAIGKVWKSSRVNYNKFGEIITEINRNYYRQSFNGSANFYSGVGTKTLIDLVVSKSRSEKLNIVVTDLFQTENDLVPIMDSIKAKCFSNNIDLGILPIKSQFSGMVYDTGLQDFYFSSTNGDESTYRTFYVLFFGKRENMVSLYKQIKGIQKLEDSQFLIISPHLLKNYSVTIEPEKQMFTKLKSEKGREQENSYRLNKKDDKKSGKFKLQFNCVPNLFSPRLRFEEFEFSYEGKKGSNKKEVNLTPDDSKVTILNSSIDSNGVFIKEIEIQPGNDPNWYSYAFYIKTPELDSYDVPFWVTDFSSSKIAKNYNPNKTLNLDKFIKGLVIRYLNLKRPVIAETFITIDKK